MTFLVMISVVYEKACEFILLSELKLCHVSLFLFLSGKNIKSVDGSIWGEWGGLLSIL